MGDGARYHRGGDLRSEHAMSAHEHDSSARAILYAFLANFGIALAKTAAAIYTRSGSLLAEAIHSYADCGNQVLLYVGLRQSARPPDAEHPLGYGKLSYFWSFVVAIILFSLGGLFSIYEGIHKLHAPETLSKPWVGLIVLAFSIVLEIGSLLGALREVNRLRGGRSLRQWLGATRNAELTVVLGEDLAAILGLCIAFVFLGLATVTGNTAFDAAGSICIGAVLIVVSVFVGWRIKALIVGRSAEPEVRAAIERVLASEESVAQVFRTLTLQLGPKVMLAAKIRLHRGISIERAVEQINALERRLRREIPELGWCFVEPDTED
jgi:cation diffusion facilitator family transporter